VITEELDLSVGLFGKWLRHAQLRLGNGRVPFALGESPPRPWLDPHEAAAHQPRMAAWPGYPGHIVGRVPHPCRRHAPRQEPARRTR
jgi:hypothetical protein